MKLETGAIYAGVIPAMLKAMAVASKTGARAEDVAIAQNAPAAAVRILRSAVGAGNLADAGWGANLADMTGATQAFLQNLGGRSAFAALLDQGIITRAPLRSNVGSVTTGAVASVVDQGDAKPVTKIAISSGRITIKKAVAITVMSAELLESTTAAAQSFVNRQLRRAVARALDVGIADSLTSGITPMVASTNGAADDLKNMLDTVNTGEGRVSWVASKDVANQVALLDLPNSKTSPQGVSEFLNIPFAVSAGLAAGTIILLDGDQVVGDVESMGLQLSKHATLEMDSEPAHDAGGVGTGTDDPTPANLVSLWQTDSVALRIEAQFGFARATNSALAIMTGVEW